MPGTTEHEGSVSEHPISLSLSLYVTSFFLFWVSRITHERRNYYDSTVSYMPQLWGFFNTRSSLLPSVRSTIYRTGYSGAGGATTSPASTSSLSATRPELCSIPHFIT